MNQIRGTSLHARVKCVDVAFLMVVSLQAMAEASQLPKDSTSRFWRNLTFSQGFTDQDYREIDPLGRVNPLDAETGSVPTTEVAMRWRGQLTSALPEVVIQANAAGAKGDTAYVGYLQQGMSLMPYTSTTSNAFRTFSVRLGFPLSLFSGQPWAQHIVPYVQHGWNHWQRDLKQYGETFDWQTLSLGVMGIWPLADLGVPQLARFSLEADVAVGRTRRPSMSALALDFAADLGEADSHSAALSLQYAVTSRWSLGLHYTTQRTSIGASASGGGLQFPGAKYNSQGWLVSVGAQL